VIDGVTLATGDRILLKDQTTGADNGIYTVNASGAPTRATDADTSAEVTGGMAVWVNEGTTNADTGWIVTTNDVITLGTTALVFSQFSGLGQVTAGTGLTKTGNTISMSVPVSVANGGTNATTTAAAKTSLGFMTRYAADVGDNAATSYNIDHNLGTKDVLVQVFQNSDGVEVECDITRSTTNRVILAFATAPATNAHRVVVIG
jgi:phage-related tail fiber protein